MKCIDCKNCKSEHVNGETIWYCEYLMIQIFDITGDSVICECE